MEPKEILARNLQTLMKASPNLKTFPQITAAGGGSNGTLDRIRRMDGNAGIDKVAALAAVFGLEPWQILVDGLMAEEINGELQVYVPAWPFPRVPLPQFMALPDEDKGYVQARLKQALEEVTPQPLTEKEQQMVRSAKVDLTKVHVPRKGRK